MDGQKYMGYDIKNNIWTHVYANTSKFSKHDRHYTCMYCGKEYESTIEKCDVLHSKQKGKKPNGFPEEELRRRTGIKKVKGKGSRD